MSKVDEILAFKKEEAQRKEKAIMLSKKLIVDCELAILKMKDRISELIETHKCSKENGLRLYDNSRRVAGTDFENDFFHHRLCFIKVDDGYVLSLLGGGACGEYTLTVDNEGVAYFNGNISIPNKASVYASFVNEFCEFEKKYYEAVDVAIGKDKK